MSYYDRDKTHGKNHGGMQWPEPHHGLVSEYQQSGIPFVYYKSVGDLDGNKIVTLTLPYVSRWIYLTLGGTITNVTVGFADVSSAAGIQSENYIPAATLNAITVPLELKCKKILIKVPSAVDDLTISLLAGLTSVRQFPDIHREASLSGISTTAAVDNVAEAIFSTADYAPAP